jgi:hypothetical protein
VRLAGNTVAALISFMSLSSVRPGARA